MMLARPSTALPSAQPVKAIEPAVMPAIRPMAPSAVIHASEAQASQCAYRVLRSQRASWLPAAPVHLSQHAQASGGVLPAASSGSRDARPVPWRSSATTVSLAPCHRLSCPLPHQTAFRGTCSGSRTEHHLRDIDRQEADLAEGKWQRQEVEARAWRRYGYRGDGVDHRRSRLIRRHLRQSLTCSLPWPS
jgi:hypothetical protein